MLLPAGSFMADGNQNNIRRETIKSQVCLRADIVVFDYDSVMRFYIVRDFEENIL